MQPDPQDPGQTKENEAPPTETSTNEAAETSTNEAAETSTNEAAETFTSEAAVAGAPGAPVAKPARPEIEHHPDEMTIKEEIIGVLRTIYDPEIPVNIYDIGLIYSIAVDVDRTAYIDMTLTSPMCPVAGTLPGEVEMKVCGAQGVDTARVELVWDPPWGIERMSEAARLQLNL